MQNQAVAQDLVHLHSDVRYILGNGLDPLNEASPRGDPRGEGRARGEPMNSPVAFPWPRTISRGHSGNQLGGAELCTSISSHRAHSRKAHFCRSQVWLPCAELCKTLHLGLKKRDFHSKIPSAKALKG